MNILIISFGIKEYDGRLAELRKVFSKIGEVSTISCSYKKNSNKKEKTVYLNKKKYLSKRNYFKFFISSILYAFKGNKIDILVADNMFASIPVLILKKLLKPKYVIQDIRELYFYEDINSKVGKLFSKCETRLMKSSDVVLCANKQRAKIMKEHYDLKLEPLVFENIRFLMGEYDKLELSEKYRDEFEFDLNIISTGGLSLQRETDKLVESMKNVPENFGLYIVGEGTINDKYVIENIISENKIKNIRFLNKVPLPELKYILSQCDIGIVHYNKLNLNNQYCASGKVYEYLAEGLPIVTTENIPLKEFCKETGVGIADDSFSNGIMHISENLEDFKKRAKKYISNISVEKYNEKVAREILQIIGPEDLS